MQAIIFILIAFHFFKHPVELNSFKFGQYLLNYEHEFIKRGFIGEVFRLAAHKPSFALFNNFSFILFFVFTLAFLLLGIRFLNTCLNKSGGWLFFSLFLAGSFSLQHFYYDIGRYDQILILITLFSIFLINRSLNIFYFTAPITIAVLLLVHEAALFIVIPFLLSYALYRQSTKKSSIILLALLVFSVVCTGLISTKGKMTSMSLEAHSELLASQHEREIGGIYVVHKASLSENIGYTLNSLLSQRTIKHHFKLIVFLIPLFLIFYPILMRDFRENGWQPKHLLLLSSFAPLGLYPLGLDFYRWWALALTNFFIANLLISEKEQQYKDLIVNVFLQKQNIVLGLLLASAILGPIKTVSAF